MTDLETKMQQIKDQLKAAQEVGAEKLEDKKKDLQEGVKDLKDKLKKPFS